MDSYAFDEERMLAGIEAFKKEQRRQGEIHEVVSVVVKRKEGCHLHGTAHLRLATNLAYVCRICLAEFSRRNYAKNKEKIKAYKRAKAKQKKAA